MSTATIPAPPVTPSSGTQVPAGTALVLGGAVAEYAVTTLHPSGEAPKDHSAVFAEYAASDTWIAVPRPVPHRRRGAGRLPRPALGTAVPAPVAGIAFGVNGVVVSYAGFSDAILANVVGSLAFVLFALTTAVAAWTGPRNRG